MTRPAGWRQSPSSERVGDYFGLHAIDGSVGIVVAVDPMGAICGPSGRCRYQRVSDGGFGSWLYLHPWTEYQSGQGVVVAGYDAVQYDLPPLKRLPGSASSCAEVARCEGLMASNYPPETEGGSSPPIAGITQAASRIVAFEVPYSQAQTGSSSVVVWLWSANRTDDVDAAVAEVHRSSMA